MKGISGRVPFNSIFLRKSLIYYIIQNPGVLPPGTCFPKFSKMNRLFLFLLVILSVPACKKDDPKDLIIGSWQAKTLVTKSCTNASDNQALTFSSGCYEEGFIGVKICINATFLANGKYDFIFKTTIFGTTETDTEQGTYSINGNELTLCPLGGDCEDSQFIISENAISLISVDPDTGCDTELTMIK